LPSVTFTIELEPEADGRWLAEVPALPGVMCYDADRDEAVARVQALALRAIAEPRAPADTKERCQNAARLRRCHAAWNVTLRNSDGASSSNV
jgi:hypothetical protein